MIIFHAKSDGTVTTTPGFVPMSSALADLVVVSEFDYAFCTIRLEPATGVHIPDIVCNFVLSSETGATIWTAPLPPEATKLRGSVEYQLIFSATDGTKQGTLKGTFIVPKGTITNMPNNVSDLEKKTVGDLYTLLANIYGVYVALDADIDRIDGEIEDLEEKDEQLQAAITANAAAIAANSANISANASAISANAASIASNASGIADLVARANASDQLVSSISMVVIPASEWAETDENPAEAQISIPNIQNNSVALLIPLNDDTRLAATEAALTVMLSTINDDEDTVIVARGDSTPSKDMSFLCFVMKGKTSEAENGAAVNYAPSVSFVGISTGAGGGGGGGGGGTGYVTFRVFNRTGWLAKTITHGATCKVSISWSSIEDGMETGDGMVEISVNGSRKAARGISQGLQNIDLAKYLNQGTNLVDL